MRISFNRIMGMGLQVGLPTLILLVFLGGYLELTGLFSSWNAIRSLAARHSVLSALDHVESVKVVEHSNQFDLTPGLDPTKETVYATVKLTLGQIEALRQALPLTWEQSPATNVFFRNIIASK
jgi:hypothetical protein